MGGIVIVWIGAESGQAGLESAKIVKTKNGQRLNSILIPQMSFFEVKFVGVNSI